MGVRVDLNDGMQVEITLGITGMYVGSNVSGKLY